MISFNNLNSTASAPFGLNRNNRLNEQREFNQQANNATSGQERFSTNSGSRVRVIQVAENSIEIEEFSADRSPRAENSAQRNTPQNQYLSNQNLLQQESLSESLGIDVFV